MVEKYSWNVSSIDSFQVAEKLSPPLISTISKHGEWREPNNLSDNRSSYCDAHSRKVFSNVNIDSFEVAEKLSSSLLISKYFTKIANNFSFFFFCTIDLNFLLDKNFWALNKIYMNYRTYYYPIIQYPQRNLFYFASLSRWRASFMRNEQEKKKINIVLSVIALEFITETETPSNLSTAFLDVRTKNYDFWRFLFDLFRKNLEKRII